MAAGQYVPVSVDDDSFPHEAVAYLETYDTPAEHHNNDAPRIEIAQTEPQQPERNVSPNQPVTIAASDAGTNSSSSSRTSSPGLKLERNGHQTDRGPSPRPESLGPDEFLSSRLSLDERLRYAISPATHHQNRRYSEKASLLTAGSDVGDTARVYEYWRQSRRLWRLSAGEWLITALLCAAYAIILYRFSRQDTVSPSQILTINSLLTMISFSLGVNLTASMRSYAKLLRWILLSLCWQPLETFDLILHCDSLMAVTQLLWRARKHKSRRLRWITQGLALLWLAGNVALTLFIGMIGLTYNLDASDSYVRTAWGTVQITNYSVLQTGDVSADLKNVQTWGVRGFNQILNDPIYSGYDLYSSQDGYTWYYFTAWNPHEISTTSLLSQVSIDSWTECTEYPVLDGGNGTSYEILIDHGGSNDTRSVTVAQNAQSLPGPGGLVAYVARCEDCLYRTTNVALFKADSTDGSQARYWECDNTLGMVTWWAPEDRGNVSALYKTAPDEYQFNNATARMLAGALGWTGNYFLGNSSTWQGSTYQNFTEVGGAFSALYGSDASELNAADFISSFTIKAVSAMDSRADGLQLYKDVKGFVPMQAQSLMVNWRNAILLLAGIPTMQLAACILVFAVANRAIIKDDSPLSMAKLYYSLLERHGLGDRGCMLKGEEIVKYIGDRTGDAEGPEVIYGWKERSRDAGGRRIGHLDVFEKRDEEPEDSALRSDSASMLTIDRGRVKRIFWGGIKYDGDGLVDARPALRRRIPRRRMSEPDLYRHIEEEL